MNGPLEKDRGHSLRRREDPLSKYNTVALHTDPDQVTGLPTQLDDDLCWDRDLVAVVRLRLGRKALHPLEPHDRRFRHALPKARSHIYVTQYTLGTDALISRRACMLPKVTSMPETEYPSALPLPTADTPEARVARGRVIAATPGAIAQVSPVTFAVRSQTGIGVYRVEADGGAATCTCPDAIKHEGTGCKHIAAVRFYLERQTVGPSGEVVSERVPITHTQAWTAYNAAQKTEVKLFDKLLSELVASVEDPRPAQVRGQPRLPLSDLLFASVQKVYSQLSCRRAHSLFGFAAERGQIARAPSYSMSSIVLNREDVTPILHDLIAKSALPLAALEENFAVDSSGFRTTNYGEYCQEAHGKNNENTWLKAHVIIGVHTHIIPKVIVTGSHDSDSPRLPELVNGAVSAGFVMKEIYADKGYLSKDNFTAVAAAGATPYIAFKSNSRSSRRGGNTGASRWWKRMYHLFQANREEWESHYHMRSNVEAGFAAIKKKLGEMLKSKNPVAQTNELLAKALAYNLTVLIHEMYEHGVVPGFVSGNGVKVIGPGEAAPALL